MRIQKLDVGVERISRWQVRDEQHLPNSTKLAPKFLPRERALDEILNRPSLDERLPNLLQPDNVDPDLLEPSLLSATRIEVENIFAAAAKTAKGARQETLQKAADILEEEVGFDSEIRKALAALLRG